MPFWLYAPQLLACLLAVLCFVVGAWCCVLAADYVNHRSTAETSASGESAPSGAGVWDVEPTTPSGSGQSEQGPQPCALSTPGGSGSAADIPTPG